MVSEKPNLGSAAIGVAWYRPEQWPRLLAISADRDMLEGSYDEWLMNVTQTLETMKSKGLNPVKVDVDTEELLGWCRSRDLPVDSKARAGFVTEKLQKIYQATPPS